MDTEELKAIEILSSAQQQYVMRLMAELKDPNQTTIHIVDSIEEQGRDKLMSCQDIEDKLALRSHRVNTNHIVKTSQDELLIVYRPNHHEEDLVKNSGLEANRANRADPPLGLGSVGRVLV